jgi:hypothetical protein
MSALLPKADIACGRLDVRFVPKSDILHRRRTANVFDHPSGDSSAVLEAPLTVASGNNRLAALPTKCRKNGVDACWANDSRGRRPVLRLTRAAESGEQA